MIFKPLYSLIVAAFFSLTLISPTQAHADEMEDVERMQAFLELLGGFYSIVDAAHEINANAEKATILQLHKIRELYEERGELSQVASVYRSVLERTKNPTIRSATYLMLGEVLKETGNFDEALQAHKTGLSENLAREQSIE
ncbi:MAG: hypothetical protein V2J55_03255 [Candidatus Competibacteraceae bacterium]|jgi:hypothetical protein|nr:hypothetical protein [Candidatus Competibacteraceae bacterium]